MKKLLLTSALVLVLAPSAVHASPDEGLYDPLPPEGSAFVRFVNDVQMDGSEPAAANGKTYDYLDYKEISDYFVVPGGEMTSTIGEASKSFNVEAGKFYTVTMTGPSELMLTEDKSNTNQAKAQIIFYNFSDSADLSVKTTDGSVEIVPPVAEGESGDREINPVKVSMGVFKGDTLVKDLGTVALDRANSYAVVAFSDNEVEWKQSATNTTR